MAMTDMFSKGLSEMTTGAKLTLGVSITLIVLIFFGLLYVVFSKNYEVLFSDLEPQAASSILKELERNKIEYKLSDNGSKILVDAGKVYETRLKVINSVPTISGGVGFEIFDKDDFGTTEFAQKINYQRALQGELARTIMSLNEVKFARVHLVLPSSSIFKRKTAESHASVTLQLKSNKTLTQMQVSGIQKLVASSAPGMKPENVTILDQNGITLVTTDGDEHNIMMASSKLKRKQEIEKYLTEKAQAILNQAFNSRNAYVSIDVALDFNNIRTTREQVISPNDKEISIAHKREMQMTGNKREKADTSRSTVEIDYQLGKEIEEIISTPGSIKRMSIAIVTPGGLEKEHLEYVKSIVGNAVGYDPNRGDLIAISTTIDAKPHTSGHIAQSGDAMLLGEKESLGTEVKQDTYYENKHLAWAADKIDRLVKLMKNNPITTFVIIFLLAAISAIAIMIALFKRVMGSRSVNTSGVMTDAERNQLLSDIKSWLAAERS